MIGIVRNVRIEERLHDDLKRKPCHVACEIALFAILPSGYRAPRVLHHHVTVRTDPLPVKRGLRETSLSPPEVTFTRYETIANETMEKRRSQ